jgi:hypothetical protein
MLGRRIKRTRSGEYQVRLPPDERDILRDLPSQLRQVLASGDPSLRRLFPPAYNAPEQAELESEYRRLMGEDLMASHERALTLMEETVDAERLDGEQLNAWAAALNELRLVLGTRLDVTEDMYEQEMDPADERAPAFALYTYLGWLQEQVVEALVEGL